VLQVNRWRSWGAGRPAWCASDGAEIGLRCGSRRVVCRAGGRSPVRAGGEVGHEKSSCAQVPGGRPAARRPPEGAATGDAGPLARAAGWGSVVGGPAQEAGHRFGVVAVGDRARAAHHREAEVARRWTGTTPRPPGGRLEATPGRVQEPGGQGDGVATPGPTDAAPPHPVDQVSRRLGGHAAHPAAAKADRSCGGTAGHQSRPAARRPGRRWPDGRIGGMTKRAATTGDGGGEPTAAIGATAGAAPEGRSASLGQR